MLSRQDLLSKSNYFLVAPTLPPAAARHIYLNLVKPKHVTFIITCALDPKPTLITVNGHHEMDKWTRIRTIIGKAGKERGLAIKLIEVQHIVHYRKCVRGTKTHTAGKHCLEGHLQDCESRASSSVRSKQRWNASV